MNIINNNTFTEFGMKPINNFMDGNIADNYTIQEEQGFPIQGAVGAILNIDKNELNNINDGLVVNPLFKTKYTNVNNINIGINTSPGVNEYLKNKFWIDPNVHEPPTPIKHCEENQVSELLPNYPNGTPNLNLTPNCKSLTLNKSGSPLLYGASTFGVNDSSLLTNPNNNIGHEIETFGLSNNSGSRALGQGKNACKSMVSGFNVPSLETKVNQNGSFLSSPMSFNEDVPLYQVGNWTEIPNNFMHNFNNAEYCS